MNRNENLEKRYLHGACYPMAIALHRATGHPISILTAKRYSEKDQLPHPAHAWVEPEAGKAFDVSGHRDFPELIDEYIAGRPAFTSESAEVESFATEEAFLARLKVLFNSEKFWPMYEKDLERDVPMAALVVRDYVLPRLEIVRDLEPSP